MLLLLLSGCVAVAGDHSEVVGTFVTINDSLAHHEDAIKEKLGLLIVHHEKLSFMEVCH